MESITHDKVIFKPVTQAVKAHKKLREFGLLVGGIFLGLGLWPLVHRLDPRYWAVGLGGALFLLGLLRPAFLQKPFELWMKLGHALGWVNIRVILSVVFFALFTPLALVFRLFSRSGFAMGADTKATTYFTLCEAQKKCQFDRIF